jgi:hypothetical protein
LPNGGGPAYSYLAVASNGPQPAWAVPIDVKGDHHMKLYAILRRDGWATADQLAEAGGRSGRVADEEMPADIRWIRSYVLDEGDGAVGTVCIYQATSHEAIRNHAASADLPVTEIIPIVDTVLVRPDPQQAGAAASESRGSAAA